MPPAVFASFFSSFTMTLSAKGFTFILFLLMKIKVFEPFRGIVRSPGFFGLSLQNRYFYGRTSKI
jgi:hypothetical protein